jgi:hypothetical protein
MPSRRDRRRSEGTLSRDAEVIERLPREPLPTVEWWQRGQERAITVRLAGREQQLVAVEEYAYPDGRRAYRIRRRDDPEAGQTIRVWWHPEAMRWGWLPPGRDARPADRWAGPGDVRRRHWREPGWPTLWVHLGGRWRPGWLWEREDWPDGAVVYHVGVEREGRERVEGLENARVIYDPASVQPRRYWGPRGRLAGVKEPRRWRGSRRRGPEGGCVQICTRTRRTGRGQAYSSPQSPS